ncbi:hypothetical protein [Deinococcus petrolearius]|uniref:Uncharacterized protein n=1 Tax=Deinococcus petrolearius TaxID=1751295 RepID=A0ABW1DM25_9DEIO
MSEISFPGRLPDGVRRILSLLAPTVDGESVHLRDSQGEVRGLIIGSTLHLEDRRFSEVRRVSVRKVGDLVAALLTLPPAASDSGTLLTHLGLFDYRIDPGGEVLLNLQGRDHVIGGVLYSHVGGHTSAERGTLHTRCACNTGSPYRDSNRPTSAVSLMREIGRAAYHALPSPYTRALAEVRETRKKLDTAAQTLRQAQQVHGALAAQLEQAQAAAVAHAPAPLPLTAPGGGPDFYPEKGLGGKPRVSTLEWIAQPPEGRGANALC